MRWFRSAVLYTCLCLCANGAAAADTAALAEMRAGDMRKLVFDSPVPVPETAFLDEADSPMKLTDLRGKYLLVNFWATWCAPCKEEMPSLSALQERFGGETFQVVTIATGRNPVAGIRRFFDETGVDNLPLYRDPKQLLAREMAVLALPITVVLDPEGREIARLRGDADWASEDAFNLIGAMIGAGG